MKIDILINCEPQLGLDNNQIIKKCKIRSEYFAYMFKKNMIEYDDVDVNIIKCYPYVKITMMFKTITINNLENTDHIIYIDDGGFYKTEPTFISQLRSIANYSITSIGKHYKYFHNEDLMFVYVPNNNFKNTYYIKPPLDIDNNIPKKNNQMIYILISKPESDVLDYKIEDTMNVLNAIEILLNNNQYERIEFKIALINQKTLDTIDVNGNIIKSKTFQYYYEYLTELNAANMYFQVVTCDDIYRLYELAMANTLIITTNIYIPISLSSELNIYRYETELDWTDIFLKMNSYNQRQYLINNGYLWENVVDVILNKLKELELIIKPDSKVQSHLHTKKLGYYLDINNKSRSQNIMTMATTTTTTTTTPNANNKAINKTKQINDKKNKVKKVPILLQSQL